MEENFDKLNAMPNVYIQLHCTVQALNMVAMNELFDWIATKNLRLEDPLIYQYSANPPRKYEYKNITKTVKRIS